jgi:hypothetical protein
VVKNGQTKSAGLLLTAAHALAAQRVELERAATNEHNLMQFYCFLELAVAACNR